MEEKQKKTYLNVLSGVVGFGVGLALVAIFLAMVSGTIGTERVGMTLFDDDVEMLGLSIGFPLVSFAVTVIGGIILVIAVTMRIKQNKSYTALIIAGVAVTAIGAILVLVAGIILKNDTNEAAVAVLVEEAIKEMGGGSYVDKETLEMAARAVISLNIGAGVYLGFIGGLVAAIGGGVLLLKPFAPTAPAAPVTQPVAPATPEQQPVAQPVAPATPEQQPVAQPTQSNTNICAHCGANLAPNATFCGKCGTRVQQPNNNDQNLTL